VLVSVTFWYRHPQPPTVAKTVRLTSDLPESILIFGISPDRRKLLVANGVGNSLGTAEVWVQPLPAGTAHRLSNISASSAAWAPGGRHGAMNPMHPGDSENRCYLLSGNEPCATRFSEIWDLQRTPNCAHTTAYTERGPLLHVNQVGDQVTQLGRDLFQKAFFASFHLLRFWLESM